MLAGNILFLFHCSVKLKSDRNELAFVRYMECEASSDEMGKALKWVCLQWAALGSEKKRDDAGRWRKIESWSRQARGLE